MKIRPSRVGRIQPGHATQDRFLAQRPQRDVPQAEMAELVPGTKVVVYTPGSTEPTEEFTVLDEPFDRLQDDAKSEWWVKKSYLSEGKVVEGHQSLADIAITPYSDGTWNPYSYAVIAPPS